MKRWRSIRLVSQICASVVLSRPSNMSSESPGRRSRRSAPLISRATQVGACTPLVIEVIGTSDGSKLGHRPANIPRLTTPCSLDTPFARWASRRPMIAMLKTRRVAALEVLGAERQDPVDRYAVAEHVGREVLLDQLDREPVDTGRDRGVGGEDGAAAGDLERGVEVEALVGGQLADPLDAEEAGVALVGVEHLGRRVAGDPAELADRADTTDTEQQLLEQPVLGRTRRTGGRSPRARRARSPRCRSRASAAARGRPGRPRSARAARGHPAGSRVTVAGASPSRSRLIGSPSGSTSG